jgi:hypothetical protein
MCLTTQKSPITLSPKRSSFLGHIFKLQFHCHAVKLFLSLPLTLWTTKLECLELEALQVRLSVAKHASLFRFSLIDLKKELFIKLDCPPQQFEETM